MGATTKTKTRPRQIQKRAKLELTIETLAYGGKGLARVEDFVVFVAGAVPGDKVLARVVKAHRNHAEAQTIEVLTPSPDRIDAPCPLFGSCGGCTWQNLPYEIQLEHKHRQVEEVLTHLGKNRPERVEPIIASPQPWRYRNKMDFTFGSDADGLPIIGFHKPKQFSKILAVRSCLLQPEPLDGVLVAIIEWARKKGLVSYDPHNHTGFLRHLILRHSVAEDAYIALLLTSRDTELPDPDGLVSALREACPALKGFVWGTNDSLSDVAKMEREAWTWGEPKLDERLGGMVFRVSPLSFFQVNTPGAEALYGVVRDMLGDEAGGMRLLDAYCGTGTIGIFCADRVAEVVGIDLVKDAIWDARLNAERNGALNCTFLAGNMREVLPLVSQTSNRSFGRIVMDPPRGGMDKRALAGLIDLGAPEIVYVSCNPSTLARDMQTITEAGYEVVEVRPVDLFPHTYHIEIVVKFVKSSAP